MSIKPRSLVNDIVAKLILTSFVSTGLIFSVLILVYSQVRIRNYKAELRSQTEALLASYENKLLSGDLSFVSWQVLKISGADSFSILDANCEALMTAPFGIGASGCVEEKYSDEILIAYNGVNPNIKYFKIKKSSNTPFVMMQMCLSLLLGLVVVWMTIFFLIRQVITKTVINSISSFLKNTDQSTFAELMPVHKIISQYKESSEKLIRSEEQLRSEIERHEIGVQISKQVAHDIRSPLSALNMVMATLKDLPEEKRLVIRNAVHRINDIANNLLQKGKQSALEAPSSRPQKDLPEQLLPAIIDSIVSEKRIQFRDKIDIKIEADLKDSFGVFVQADATELSRIVSNLVNNSVEAFANETGEVVVSVRGYKEQAVVTVRDNGVGIPPHILEKIGQQGVSHGKKGTDSGSGLGVYHAKKTIEEWRGKLQISSKEGVGTNFEIILPRVASPIWFASCVQIPANATVVAVDDDFSIHQIWKGRLESMQASQNGITLKSFTSALDFMNLNVTPEMVFLVDYEFLNQQKNGLDLIRDKNIGERAVLVTSRYEEPHIIETCERSKIKLLPKSLAGFVPIVFEVAKKKIDIVLIDDDTLVHQFWKMGAKEKSKTIKTYLSYDDFLKDAEQIDRASKIFVDVNLGKDLSGESIRGEAVVEKVFALKFTDIYLATGYQAEDFDKPVFVRAIVGKDFPLSLIS